MTDLVLPQALRVGRSNFRYIGNTGVTRGAYNGVLQTTGMGGDRVGASLDFTFHGRNSAQGRSERAQLMAFEMRMRAKQGRVWMTDTAHVAPRGSFPTSEVLANSDLSSTTGWTAQGSIALTSADGVIRGTLTGQASTPAIYQQPAVTANVPYVLRSMIMGGAGLSGISLGAYLGGITSYSTTRGYHVVSVVPSTTPVDAYPLVVNASSGYLAGAFAEVHFASLSRCFLVDGAPNLVLQSNAFNTTWVVSGCTISANALTDPFGTATAEILVENGLNSVHVVGQTSIAAASAAGDYAYTVAVFAGNRTFVALNLEEETSATGILQYFNLSTGQVGVNGATGANWSNRRAFIDPAGGGWYWCTVVGRKTNAATLLTARVYAASADGTLSYTGGSFNAIGVWGATVSPSGVPSRKRDTTTTAAAAETQTGSVIHVKGLPASTSGLLLIGDWIEIDGQLKMVTAKLDSNGAGLGKLEFSPPLYRAVSDNTPIIVHKPMGRFVLASEFPEWLNEPGLISTSSLDFEEAFA